MSVILFPRKPATIPERAAEAMIRRLHDMASEIAAQECARFIDPTLGTPVDDTHFMDDHDNVIAKGSQELAHWALDNDLAFQIKPPTTP